MGREISCNLKREGAWVMMRIENCNDGYGTASIEVCCTVVSDLDALTSMLQV